MVKYGIFKGAQELFLGCLLDNLNDSSAREKLKKGQNQNGAVSRSFGLSVPGWVEETEVGVPDEILVDGKEDRLPGTLVDVADEDSRPVSVTTDPNVQTWSSHPESHSLPSDSAISPLVGPRSLDSSKEIKPPDMGSCESMAAPAQTLEELLKKALLDEDIDEVVDGFLGDNKDSHPGETT